ncbi:uncharacterized protein LOC110465926 [Mizuhopecten yessoensis]|uniref:uncharacterized protein LOC110465926 n=1 Tax=Mizuhopecten yessoensis TaxID=6573 RepID=UPI000B45ABF7|nr:uncharacterized protein LOC110465926 [Mizuhopecten yessoensis]
MSKLVEREWLRHAKALGRPLPRLTATMCRKMAVTALRNSGGDREAQRSLAKHMAHLPSTADRYYDRCSDRQNRAKVLQTVKERYMKKAQVVEEEKKEDDDDSDSDMIRFNTTNIEVSRFVAMQNVSLHTRLMTESLTSEHFAEVLKKCC